MPFWCAGSQAHRLLAWRVLWGGGAFLQWERLWDLAEVAAISAGLDQWLMVSSMCPGARGCPPCRQDLPLLLAEQREVWLFRSSAARRAVLCQWEVLWKAGQLNPGSGAVWKLIRREYEAKIWTKHMDPCFLFAGSFSLRATTCLLLLSHLTAAGGQ